jgi:predicted DsbA family dithiol-disulfide isomerase
MKVTLYTDPGCPWAYSEIPALRVLDWRYGDQLDWRLVLIGLTDDVSQYVERGYTPVRSALGQLRYRRYGMPFAPQPKERVSATGRACRAVIAARLQRPHDGWRALRALQFANFTTALLLDDDGHLLTALRTVNGLDADAIVSQIDSAAVNEAYQTDRAEARMASGSPAELQEKTANTDGVVRYTAPSLVFEYEGRRLVAGGFQPVEAYDVCVVNLDPTLRRESPPETPLPLLERYLDGLTTQEVAALMAVGNDAPDRYAAEEALLRLVGDGVAARHPLGDDALWYLAQH